MAAIELALTPLFNDPNLVSYYELENTADSKGSNTLANNGSVPFSTGLFHNGAAFDGTLPRYLSTGNGILSFSDLAAFTVTFWFNPSDATQGDLFCFCRATDTSNIRQWGITWRIDVAGAIAFHAFPSGGGIDVNTNFSAALTNGSWVFVCAVYDGSFLRLYINGVAAGTPSAFSWGTFALNSQFSQLGGSGGSNSYGTMDDMAFFNRVLTPAEISNLFNGTFPNVLKVSGVTPSNTSKISSIAAASISKVSGVSFSSNTIKTMYMMAGGSGVQSTPVSTNYQYSQGANVWYTKPAVTAARFLATNYGIGTDKSYVTAGINSGVHNDNYEFSQAAESWATKTAIASGNRWDLNSATIGADKMYLYFGNNGSYTTLNEEYSQGGDSWSTKTAGPTAHGSLCCGSPLGTNLMYSFGGYISTPQDAMYEYSQGGDSWATKTSSGSQSVNPSLYYIGSDKVYGVGGNNGAALSFNQEFSSSGNSWATKTALPVAKNEPGGINVDNDHGYCTGGDNNTATVYDTNYQYSQTGNSWATQTAMTSAKDCMQGSSI